MEILLTKPRNEEELIAQVDLLAANAAGRIIAYEEIPYHLIQSEVEAGSSKIFQEELNQIMGYYAIYHRGESFTVEGSGGDYVPANLKYRLSATLINKQARFLFSKSPDITIKPRGEISKAGDDVKRQIKAYNELIKNVLEANMFEKDILQAARDCFIGKRIAILVNFNTEDGITINFIPSTNFIYEYRFGSKQTLSKFVTFIDIERATLKSDSRMFKKKYTLEKDEEGNDVVCLEEYIIDGNGFDVEVVLEKHQTSLSKIPATIVTNDGLTGDMDGESEIDILKDYESWYSKLANSDKDAERKSMNPTRYTVDMSTQSTRNLSSSAGSYWDLQTNQNLDKPQSKVGLLESSMSYSNSLKSTLDRLKMSAYEQVDVPYINLDSMSGQILSGKSLKAIYWPLIIRCQEKMKTWGPMLKRMVGIIIDGALIYSKVAEMHVSEKLAKIPYEVEIMSKTPLPEDENEEKTIDMAEVTSQVLSRKTYMKKWFKMTDDEADAELRQIAEEREILEDTFSGTMPKLKTLTGFDVSGDSDVRRKERRDLAASRLDSDNYSGDAEGAGKPFIPNVNR